MTNARSIQVRPWGLDEPGREFRARTLLLAIAVAGPVYGATMGSFLLDTPERLLMLLYAGVKVPMLIVATGLVCLPGFFVINSVLGLRPDFRAAMRAVLASQAALTIALASLAPITRFAYFCAIDHRQALLLSAFMFTLATAAGHVVMLRRYRPLIARAPAHRVALVAWVVMYAFVGIQMGWMSRPFVGTPGVAVSFLRDEPFTNAYVAVAKLVVPRYGR